MWRRLSFFRQMSTLWILLTHRLWFDTSCSWVIDCPTFRTITPPSSSMIKKS